MSTDLGGRHETRSRAVRREPAATGPAVIARRGTPGKGRGRTRVRETLAGYTFLLPWLIGLLVLTAGPMLASLYLSFTRYDLFSDPTWVGVENYARMLDDARFIQSVRVTALFVVIGVPLKLAVALTIAVLLDKKVRGLTFYRSAFYAPSLIGSSVSIAVVWKLIFAEGGGVDTILSALGLRLGGWAGNPDLALPMLVALAAWQFGAPMVIFLAGLKNVPPELLEAAQIDGAGAVRRFLKITVPMISPVIFFNMLLETVNAFQVFTAAYIVGGPGGAPGGSTLFYTVYLYSRGFMDRQMGYASAMAWVLVVAVGIVAIIMFRTSRSWVHYSGDR